MTPDILKTGFANGSSADAGIGEIAMLEAEVIRARARIQACPEDYAVYGRLAKTLATLCRYREALECYALALQKTPDPYENRENLFGLGELYKRLRVFEKAAECYQYVLKMAPDHRGALLGLSQIARQQGDTETAEAIGEQMLALWPDDIGLLIGQALSLPVIYDSVAEIDHWRNKLESRIDTLLAREIQPDPSVVLHGGFFYLGYQGRNDRVLAEKIACLCGKLLPSPPARPPKSPGAKPKIGIVSRYLSPAHTIGKLTNGLIRHLPRERFEVQVFALGPQAACDSPSDDALENMIILPATPVEEAARRIVAERPDILLYADVGMNVPSYCLAAMRLAPVQCVTWGHPVTTGLPTVDYFISSRLLEPEDAQDHYRETLIRLEHLPTYYYRPRMPEEPGERKRFGLDDAAHVYLCPQSIFKFHPDFDPLLKGVLERDASGVLVLLSHYSPAVNQRLLQRFRRSMPEDLINRIRFLPRLEADDFLRLLTCADVMLDPIGFGGGNTTYEALAAGLPIVTLPGPMMRGRVTAGCYHQMGVTDCIAESPAHYVELAIRLGCDPEENRRVRVALLSKADVLYENPSVLHELETFFLRAMAAAEGNEGGRHA